MLITVLNSPDIQLWLKVLAQQIFECIITLIRWELGCLSPCVKQTHHLFIESLKLDETLKDLIKLLTSKEHYIIRWIAFSTCLNIFQKGDAVRCLVAQSRPTLCNPMDCSLPGSSVHGDSPSMNTGVGCHALLRGSFQTRDRTQVSCIAGRFFNVCATREAQEWIGYWNG